MNFAARAVIVSSTSSSGGGSPWIQRSGFTRATTNAFRYGLANPFAYIAINSLLAVIPFRSTELGFTVAQSGWFWSVWLLTRSGVDAMYREQLMMWLEDQFDTNAPYRDFVTGLITATGKSNENGAVHFVFRHIGDPLNIDNKTGNLSANYIGF